MKFKKAIQYYAEWGRMKYSRRTLEVYTGHLNRFCEYIKDKDIQEVNLFEDVLTYARHLEKVGLNDATINLAMTSIRQLWKAIYALERQFQIKLSFQADMIPVKSGIIAKSHKPISHKEFEKLVEAISNTQNVNPFIRLRDLVIFRFLYDTGVRVSELTSLDVSSLDLERRSAKVITRKRRDTFKHREVYWTLDTHYLILKYLDQRKDYTEKDILFINTKTFARITTRTIQRFLKNYLRSAGIDPSSLSPHSFRHSVGMRAAQKQMYPPLLQAYLGHKNSNSSQIYYNIQNESLKHEYHTKLGDMTMDKVITATKIAKKVKNHSNNQNN